MIFGLIHGLGFAAFISEFDLSETHFWSALIGFNIGVEIGQLLIVAIVWFGFFRYMHTRFSEKLHGAITDFAGIAMCGIGMFWFASRLLI